MDFLHKCIVKKRNDFDYLLSIIPLCNYEQLLCILNTTNKNINKETIHKKILENFKEIKICKNKNKYRIKFKMIFEYKEDNIDNFIDHINVRGCKEQVLDKNTHRILDAIKSKKLTDVGCRNILANLGKFNVSFDAKEEIFQNYQNLEFIRVSLFDIKTFEKWIFVNQYIYLENNQNLLIKRLYGYELKNKKQFMELLCKMIKSENEARRHLGVLLAKNFGFIDFLKSFNLSYDVNQSIRNLYDKLCDINFNNSSICYNKVNNKDITDYRIRAKEFLREKHPLRFDGFEEFIKTFKKDDEFLLNSFILCLLNSISKKENEKLFFELKNELQEKYFLNGEPMIDFDYILEKDWHIFKELITLLISFKMENEAIKVLLKADHFGLNGNVRELFKFTDFNKLTIDIKNIIYGLNKNSRKSGGLSALFELNTFEYDSILSIYIESTEIYVKFHCLNIFATFLRQFSLEPYKKLFFDLKCDFILRSNELSEEKKNFLYLLSCDDLKESFNIQKEDNFLKSLKYISYTKNERFLVVDFITFIFSLAFDALNNDHFSIKNGGITLLTLLFQKLESHKKQSLQFFENQKLREILFLYRNKHKMYVLKTYSFIQKLHDRENEFIKTCCLENSYEGVYAKTLLEKSSFEIKNKQKLVFKENLENYKKYFYITKILNSFEETETFLALNYIKEHMDINAQYVEEARILLMKKAKIDLSLCEMDKLVQLLNKPDVLNITDFQYDLDILLKK
ncbi:hypothetical protein EHP00_670 [Ecytonucleospora hepatopenaei]|uniref:Uncharacterized protein n=1 Tax=Ecytonucleospora hepatopenaei TaxID=646526 RepID=A0A1W0E8N4_9MICR|nr:hypothetical protein EHP00_2559 [Ecytonucleospora hepatopenaei]OQS55591.1 hypothetical protein EHP00_670 [Ecytonucleospora hepatopenaei]